MQQHGLCLEPRQSFEPYDAKWVRDLAAAIRRNDRHLLAVMLSTERGQSRLHITRTRPRWARLLRSTRPATVTRDRPANVRTSLPTVTPAPSLRYWMETGPQRHLLRIFVADGFSMLRELARQAGAGDRAASLLCTESDMVVLPDWIPGRALPDPLPFHPVRPRRSAHESLEEVERLTAALQRILASDLSGAQSGRRGA